MYKIFLVGSALALAAPGAAAATIDLPPETFTYSGNTRGYWFTAPVDFVMRGVLVPTTASTGPQSVAVLRLNGTPPGYPGETNAFETLYLSQNSAGTTELPLSLQFLAGDIVGILGMRDDVNSYANGNYVASLGGNAITLQRLGMQYSLANTAPRDIWTESGGSISRVSFSYDLGRAVAAVPEPSTWAMLIFGFGAIGATMRRRSQRSATVRASLTYA